MKQFIKRLKYLFTSTEALDILIAKEQRKIDDAERENQIHRLDLCYKHRQEPNRSHYSEHNCYYCQLQAHSAWQHSEILRKDALLRGAVDAQEIVGD